MTKERARYLLDNMRQGGDFRYSYYRAYAHHERLYADGITADEDQYVKQVWDAMPGNTCYHHAVRRIADGRV